MRKLSLLLLSCLSLVITTLKVSGQCTPSFYSASSACSYGMDISSFRVTGASSTSISDASSCSGSGYTDRTSRDSCSMMQANTYTANISCSGYYRMTVETWIDFNNNSTFESSESVGGTNSYSYSTSYSLVIPFSATVGRHKMRVLTWYDYSGSAYPGLDPCASGYTYGEARDYIVTILALPTCTGTPTGGTTVASIGTACPGARVDFTLSGTTLASSLSYQWQSSTDSTTWTNISGATLRTYSTTSISTSTYFRCIITCATSSANSVPVRVNYISVCYCTPTYSYASAACSTYGMDIASFRVAGHSGSTLSDAMACDGSGYRDRTALSVDVMQSRSYATTISCSGTYRLGVQAWIDFNVNGTFESSETVGGIGSYSGVGYFTITLPFGAPVGTRRLRISSVYSATYPSIDPCGSYSYGETRDYTVNILALPACTGMPSGGVVLSSTGTACPSRSFTLTDTGFTSASSIALQWEISSDSSSWSRVSGATSASLTTTISGVRYFRVLVRCTATGDSAYSRALRVNYISACYCIPSYLYASASCSTYGMDFANYRIVGHSGSTLNDVASCDGSGYLDRSGLSVDLMQSIAYNTTMTPSGTYTLNVQNWIDFNDNGTFESTETVGGRNGYSSTTNYFINIPITARVGSHRMRVMVSYYSSGGTYPSMDPCTTSYYYGETRDYTVNILALPACTGRPSAGRVVASTTIACPTVPFTVTDTLFTAASGLSWQWQRSTDSSTWTSISGATSFSYSTAHSAATYYRVIVTCGASSSSDTTAGLRVGYISACFCTPTYTYDACFSTTMDISLVRIVGHSGSTFTDVASCDGTGYLNRTSLSVDMQQAGSYTGTISTSGYYTLNMQSWIDFDDDGIFTTAEIVGGYNSYSYSTTYNIRIPVGAPVGRHRMRVRAVYAYSGGSYPTIDPCSTYSYGEARDYTANIVALPPCTGMPSPGIVRSTVGIACPSTPFTLTDTGFSVAGSLSFQWQRSSDSSTWTSISGATNFLFTTTISARTYFRCIVKCVPTSDSAFTAGLLVDYISVCYCTPRVTSSASCSTYGMDIASYRVTGHSGSSLSDAAACVGTGYLDRTSIAAVDMMQSIVYTATTTCSGYYSLNIQTWIDFNDNGTFETAEIVGGQNGYSSSTTYRLTIPIAAATGRHRMRVRVTYSTPTYPSIDPCASYTYGEARDYMVNIVALPPCTGTPTPGTVSASLGTACPSRSFTLVDSGFSVAGSLAFQWQKSTDSTSWSDISGATSTYFTTTTVGITFYRCIVTCTATGDSAATAGLKIYYDSVCYCFPAFSYASAACSTYGMNISQLTVFGESGTRINDLASCNGSGYLDRTMLSADLMQSLSYNTTLSASAATYTLNTQTWIDFNNNGTFESTETVGGVNNYSGTTVYTITIPMTAPTGRHRMRVMVTYASSGYSYPSLNPCAPSSYSYGEVRDYIVNVVALPACSGTPNAGYTSSTHLIVCPGNTFTMTPAGYTPASGLTFQWQSSSDSSSWSDISGATSFSYTASISASTYFRVVFTCTASGASSAASAVYVTYRSSCYCTSSYTYASSACSAGYTMSKMIVRGHGSTGYTDVAGCSGSGYINRSGLSVDMMQSLNYNFSVYTRSTYYSMNSQIWIDFNDNGTFESTETVGGYNAYTATAPGADTIHIPMTATPGRHMMRVRTCMVYSTYGSYPTMDPCTTYSYGETRDYTANILALPPCTGTPTAGAAVASVTTACPSTPFTLSLAGFGYASGLGYQWQISADGTSWTNMSGATTMVTTTSHSAPRYYRCIVTCISTSDNDTSTSVYVGYISYCYCSPSYSAAASACSTYGLSLTRVRIPGYGGTMLNDSNTCTGAPGYQILTGLTVAFLQGSTDTAYVSMASSSNYLAGQVWVDFNDNGTFEASERVGGISSFTGSTVFYLTIPTSARLGSHRMRFVTSWTSSGYTYPGLDPCTAGYSMGEARDYTANIVLPGCTGTPTAGTVTATPATGCVSYSTTLTSTGATSGTGISTSWEFSTDSTTWYPVGSTAASYTTTVTSTRYYREAIYCATSAVTVYSAPVKVTVLPAPGAISGPSFVCSGSSITLSSATSGGTWSTATGAIASVVPSTGVLYGVSTGSVVVTYTAASGCSATAIVAVNPSPAAITGTTSACVGATTTLASATIGGTWSSANPAVASISSTGVAYGVASGTVVISYSLATGCSGPAPVATTTVTINPLPAAISGSTSICLGSTSMLSSATSPGTWASSASTIAAIDTLGRVRGITTGTVTITYTARTTGCRITTSVTVNPLTVPTLSMSASSMSVCSGSSVTFTAATTNAGSAPTYVWSVNGTILSGGTSYTYAPANGDLVKIWFRSSANCATPDSMSSTLRMSVTPSSTPAVSTSTGMGDTVCTGSSVTFTATPIDGGSAPIYRWWVNGSMVSSSTSTYTYTPSHGDVITTRIISNAVCRTADSANTTKIITVSAPVTPAVTLNALSGTNICSGNVANFSATGVNGGSTPSFWWTVNGTTTGSGSTFSYTPSNGDVVMVNFGSSFPCVTRTYDSSSVVMSVIPVVSPATTIAVTPGYIVTAGTVVTFTCSITSGGGSTPTYQWTRNSAAIAGATNATYTTSSFTSGDAFTCIVTNNDPCSGVSTFASSIVMTIGTFTGVNNVNNGKADLLIMPNPNSGSFVIKGSMGVLNDQDVTIEITDMLGQVVHIEKVRADKGEINQSVKLSGSLANGMYLVNIKSATVNQVFHFVLEQ